MMKVWKFIQAMLSICHTLLKIFSIEMAISGWKYHWSMGNLKTPPVSTFELQHIFLCKSLSSRVLAFIKYKHFTVNNLIDMIFSYTVVCHCVQTYTYTLTYWIRIVKVSNFSDLYVKWRACLSSSPISFCLSFSFSVSLQNKLFSHCIVSLNLHAPPPTLFHRLFPRLSFGVV